MNSFREWHVLDATMSQGRRGGVTAILQEKLYVTDGCCKQVQLVESLDLRDSLATEWESHENCSLPIKRRGGAVATIGDDKMILVGGWNGREVLGTVMMFNARTESWTQLPSLITPRSFCACVVLQNHVFAIGGFDGRQRLKTVEVLDLTTIIAPTSDSSSSSSLPTSTASPHWAEMKANLRMARSGCAAVALPSEQICVVGGMSNEGKPLASAEIFDVKTGKWSSLPDMSCSRSACAATIIENDQVVVLGGTSTTSYKHTLDSVEVFRNGQWLPMPPMTQPRWGCCAVTTKDDKIFVVGGGNREHDYLNTVEVLDVDVVVPNPPKLPPALTAMQRQHKMNVERWMEQVNKARDDFEELVKTKQTKLETQEALDHARITSTIQRLERGYQERKQQRDSKIREMGCKAEDLNRKVERLLQNAQHDLDLLLLLNQGRPSPSAPVESSGVDFNDNNNEGQDIPHHLLCPITLELMTDPVIAADGETYERKAIQLVLDRSRRGQARSPMTNQLLAHRMLTPNIAIKRLVTTYRDEQQN